VDRKADEPVGMAGLLMQTVHEERIPEIGYMMRKERWREGLASEAALAIKEYAYNSLNYPFVISLIRPVNIPSQGVAKKLGMLPWKTTIHADLEHIVFRVDKSGNTDWSALWQKAEPTQAG
jgi:ribosomal-protein-alanine N-acetyltransferase